MTEISQTERGVSLIALEKLKAGSALEDPLHKTMTAQRSAEMACLLEPKHVMTDLKIMKDAMMTAQVHEMGIFALKIRLVSAVEFTKISKVKMLRIVIRIKRSKLFRIRLNQLRKLVHFWHSVR